MSEKLIFPIGFDLEEGVKEASKEWKSTYQKQLQRAIDDKPLKVKIDFESKGIDTKEFKQWMALSREAEKLERERIKNAKEWQKVADQQAMAETRRANATNESNARIERANRKAEASEQRKRTAVERTNAAYKTQNGYLSRLFQRMVAYASVAQAFSFVRNIRDVTAEFELQRVALGSIIGDLNEANAMFEQIKAAAVKSPFQIKELVTYTKQLAAYKIESDELFETTQRLADISAGLGVGMERLVLAYGQIRATGYLRASEVRQLTEAGIPIVEELAKKMSQLRGETVSAAEVMGLISERAISFGMVKEVFDDMTSAGGMFYKMQEKQAETLAGQWSNLKDSIAIMYEEIGNTESVNNAMKGMIGLVKSLAENWRNVRAVIVSLVASYLTYKLAMQSVAVASKALTASEARRIALETTTEARMPRLIRLFLTQNGAIKTTIAMNKALVFAQTKSLMATNLLSKAFWKLTTAMLSNPYTAILAALAGLAALLLTTESRAKRLNEELSKIGKEGALQADQSVRNFERLAKAVRENVDGSVKQTKALKEMKRAYGEFLPSQDKSIINLVREKDGYNAITQAIREKIALQIQEQKLNTIASEHGGILGDYQGKVRENLEKDGWHRDTIYAIFEAIENEVKEGTLDISNVAKRLPEIFKQITGESLNFIQILSKSGSNFWGTPYLLEYIKNLNIYEDKLKDIISESEASVGIFGKYTQAYKDFKEELKGITGTGEEFSFEWDESKTKKTIEAYNNFVAKLLKKNKIKFDIGDVIDFDELEDALDNKFPQLKRVFDKIRGEYESLVGDETSEIIKQSIVNVATITGVSLTKVKQFMRDNNESTEAWSSRLKTSMENATKTVTFFGLAWKNALSQGDTENANAMKSELDDAKQLQKFFQELNKLWQFNVKKGGGGRKKDPWIQNLELRMKYMEDFHKGVEKLSKSMNRDIAISEQRLIMMNRGLALGLQSETITGSSDELIKWYENAIEELVKKIRANNKGLRKRTDETIESVLGFKSTHAPTIELQKVLASLYEALTGFKTDEATRVLERKMKEISDNLSRTKTAKEFFDRMLGMTGDRELSATLTMSVYGIEKPEGELSKFFAKQLANDMQKQIQEYLPNIDISSAINEATGEIDPVKLKGIVDALDPLKAGPTNIDAVKKLIKEMIDGNAKYLESLYDSYEKFLDYEHRKTIVAEREAEERKKIAEQNIPEDEKKKLTEASKKRERTEKLKIDIEQFKAGEEYVKIFEEIENLSTMSIGRLMGALDKFMKDNAAVLAENPEQLKTLMGEYQKLYEGLITRNPFRAIVDGLKEYQSATKNVISARKELKKAEDSGDEAKIASAEAKLADALDKQQEALNKQVKGYQAASSAISNFGSIITDITEILGIAEDSEAGVFIKDLVKWLGIMATVLSTVAAILVVINTVGAPFLAIAAGIAAIAAGISYLANAKVRKANKEIERQQELLDNLSYSYDRLQKSAERAFGTEYIQNYQRQLANLEAQVDAYEKQLEAERSKGKKADEDKIKEYENQIRDTKDAIEDMYGSLSEHFLGTDLTSAARDFASAWIDAYKEFANTTDAMKEKFQDMIQNMIVESLIAKVMERALRPVFDMVDDMGDSDFYSNSFWSQLMTEMNKATENGVVGAQNIMGMLESIGINLRDTGTGLTGISRDIATASEESILGLAAGINTQNFYISQVPTKLDTIIGLLRGENAMQGSAITLQDLVTIQNQHLSHLPSIAQHTADTVAECKQIVAETRRTADALERVIKPRGTQATHTVNTSL